MNYPRLGKSPRKSIEEIEQEEMESSFAEIASCEDDIIIHEIEHNDDEIVEIVDDKSGSSFLSSMIFSSLFILFVIITESVMK
tara:strand:+ start:5313 stop:5561 length:249 start_codon:yes stop_codon:yes gene_type:complete